MKKKKVNIFLFFIFMSVLFIIADVIYTNLVHYFGSSIIYGLYTKEIVAESLFAVIVLIILLLFKNGYIFTEKREKLIPSIFTGTVMLVIGCFSLLMSGASILLGEVVVNRYDLISLILFSLLIGIAEEFLCRGWLLNEFLERYSSNRKQVYLSIFFSGLVFGLMHVTNIYYGQGILETIAQIIAAIGMGFYLGSIYFRTRNIWACVILHGFWDFALLLGENGVINTCIEASYSNSQLMGTVITQFFIAVIYILIGLFITRKSKTYHLIPGEEKLTEEELKKERKRNIFIIIACIVIYVIVDILALTVYDDNQECMDYDIKEIATLSLTYPQYNEYEVNLSNNEFNFIRSSNLELLVKNGEDKIKLANYTGRLVVVENEKDYTVLYTDKEYVNYIILEKDKKYSLSDIKDEIVTLDYLSDVYDIGYLNTQCSNYNYPLIELSSNNYFTILNNNLTLLEYTGNEECDIVVEDNKLNDYLSNVVTIDIKYVTDNEDSYYYKFSDIQTEEFKNLLIKENIIINESDILINNDYYSVFLISKDKSYMELLYSINDNKIYIESPVGDGYIENNTIKEYLDNIIKESSNN